MSFNLIPKSLRSSWNDLVVNCVSQSEIMLSGSPNCLWWSKISPAPSSVRVFEQGVRITPFVSPWSTMDKVASMMVPLLEEGQLLNPWIDS